LVKKSALLALVFSVRNSTLAAKWLVAVELPVIVFAVQLLPASPPMLIFDTRRKSYQGLVRDFCDSPAKKSFFFFLGLGGNRGCLNEC